MHCYEDLIKIFNNCFSEAYSTRLVKGDDEPIYLPRNEERPYHAIYFANGFFSSALHECAHWLIAGDARRQLEDFGYWYVPDGRSSDEQNRFLQVEVKPQAIEWILSMAAGFPFRISVDNLNGDAPIETTSFKEAVYEQVLEYCTQGLSKRAECLYNALCEFYGNPNTLDKSIFLNQLSRL